MKKKIIPLLLAALLFLGGCGEKEVQPASTETPEPIGLNVFTTVSPDNSLASRLNAACRPFQTILSKVAATDCSVIDYCIPGQILADAGSDALSTGATVTNGRYSFTADKGGRFVYTVWGQDVIEALQTPVPEDYDYSEQITDHMEYVYSDTQNEGGGVFATRCVYDIAEDGKSGAIEVYSTLDGQINGHERFDFIIRDDLLCFTDAALDAYSIKDGQYPYIIVCGVISTDSLYTVNYTVTNTVVSVPTDYPSVNTLTLSNIQSFPNIENSLSVQNGKAVEAMNGKFTTYMLP